MTLTDDQATRAAEAARNSLRAKGIRDGSDLDDMVQEVMLRLLEAPRLRYGSIEALARSVARDRFAAYARRRVSRELTDEHDLPAPELPEDRSEDVDGILKSGVSDKQREVLFGLAVGKTVAQIARRLGVTTRAINMRLARARNFIAPSSK